jgi:hypothetical protein
MAGVFLPAANSYSQIKVLPPESGIYHTAFSGLYSKGSKIVSIDEVTKFETLVNKKIVWLNFNDNWFDGIKFPLESVKNIYSQGVIPSIRIMPWSKYDKEDQTYSLDKIISGKFDKELTLWANDAASCGIPLLIDIAPEPNGDWFPWSGVFNGKGEKDKYGSKDVPDGPEKFKDVYKHIVNIFKDAGCENITYVFHINSVSAPDENWNKIINYYPGDDYVDWIGINIYGPQMWGDKYTRFIDILDPVYPELCSLSSEKPIAILEFGVADYLPNVNKAIWLQSALYTVALPEYNRIKAIGWWHSTWFNKDGTISALQIDSSPHALITYKEGIAQSNFVSEVRLSK